MVEIIVRSFSDKIMDDDSGDDDNCCVSVRNIVTASASTLCRIMMMVVCIESLSPLWLSKFFLPSASYLKKLLTQVVQAPPP